MAKEEQDGLSVSERVSVRVSDVLDHPRFDKVIVGGFMASVLLESVADVLPKGVDVVARFGATALKAACLAAGSVSFGRYFVSKAANS